MEKDNKYYVYVHLDSEGVPFYVGKGQNKRAWHKGRTEDWKEIAVLGYKVQIYKDNMFEVDALKLEEELTLKIGRRCDGSGTLINIQFGTKLATSTKKKLRIANSAGNNPMFGKVFSKEHKKKLSIANSGENNPMFGKVFSKEHREKISRANKGRKKVINTETGEVYKSLKEAYDDNDFDFTYKSFLNRLNINDLRRNTTTFVKLEDLGQ